MEADRKCMVCAEKRDDKWWADRGIGGAEWL
jgi:hypothetical protein